jgi:hypothetical protein
MVVNDELGYMGREVVVAYLKVLLLHLAGRVRRGT